MPLRVPSSSGSASSSGACKHERVGLELVELVLGRVDEERLCEQRVVRRVGDDAHADPVRRIGAGERVDDVENRTLLEIGDDLVAQPVELLLGELAVHVAPPDARLRAALAHDELVLRRAPGVDPGVDDERPAFGEHALVARERVRVEHRDRRISIDPALSAAARAPTAPRSRCAQPWPPSLPIVFTASTKMPQFAPPTSLTDGVVTLRPWNDDDAEALVRRINDPDVAAFLDLVPQPYTLDDARDWFVDHRRGLAQRNVGDVRDPRRRHRRSRRRSRRPLPRRSRRRLRRGRLLGRRRRARTRRRDGGDAARGAAGRSRPCRSSRGSQLRAAVENVASNRVAEKAGFTREGVLRAQRYNARLDKRVDFVMWSLLREEL